MIILIPTIGKIIQDGSCVLEEEHLMSEVDIELQHQERHLWTVSQ